MYSLGQKKARECWNLKSFWLEPGISKSQQTRTVLPSWMPFTQNGVVHRRTRIKIANYTDTFDLLFSVSSFCRDKPTQLYNDAQINAYIALWHHWKSPSPSTTTRKIISTVPSDLSHFPCVQWLKLEQPIRSAEREDCSPPSLNLYQLLNLVFERSILS